jgi:hypothetical protein
MAEDLFEGANQQEVSHGLFFLTDSLRHKATESWHREILVEAENTEWGRTNLNANVYFRTSVGSGFSASSGKYITVEPTVLNDISEVSVTFPIPNTLSASYLIYCVFMPEIIADTSSHKPNIVTFSIDYVDSNGKQLTNQTPNSWKNIVTKANDTTMVNLGKFTFPYSNIFKDDNSSIKVKIKARNAVKKSQTTQYTRTMRIDCLILKPVD